MLRSFKVFCTMLGGHTPIDDCRSVDVSTHTSTSSLTFRWFAKNILLSCMIQCIASRDPRSEESEYSETGAPWSQLNRTSMTHEALRETSEMVAT